MKDTLRELRYDGTTGYVWINDTGVNGAIQETAMVIETIRNQAQELNGLSRNLTRETARFKV